MTSTLEIFADYLNQKKASDDGAVGKAFEVAIRKFLQPTSKREGVTHAYASYGDIRLKMGNKWAKVEVKSACGELATISAEQFELDASANNILPKADYVIYCPEVCQTMNMEEQAFVFTRDEFVAMVNSYGGRGAILRTKYASREQGYRISFQSFRAETRPKASKPIADHIWDCCYNQPTVKEWMESVRG